MKLAAQTVPRCAPRRLAEQRFELVFLHAVAQDVIGHAHLPQASLFISRTLCAQSYGQLGLGDTNKRLVLLVFGGSKVRTFSCGDEHKLVVAEAGELWAWGKGAHGRLGLNDEQRRLVTTRVDPHHFAHAPISAVAAGDSHSAAVIAGGSLYTWAKCKSDARSLRKGGTLI